jgi:hypothetical protein
VTVFGNFWLFASLGYSVKKSNEPANMESEKSSRARRLSHTSGKGLAWVALFVALGLSTLTGCGASGSASASQEATGHSGSVRSGNQPVSGSNLQLYAAGINGVGSAAQPLLSNPVQSDSSGEFLIPTNISCPSPSSQVFAVASGGNPGLASGTNNPALALMAVLGSCSSLSAATPISIDEVTTVGSVWPLASYMKSPTDVGSAAGDSGFLSAVSSVPEFINLAQDTSPGTPTATSYFAENSKLYSLADALANCAGSSGGSAGDGSPCGLLFSMATSAGGTPPTDTITAAMQIAQNPYNNVTGIFSLVRPNTPFQPTLSAAPADWTLNLTYVVATPTISLGTGSYVGPQEVTITDSTAGSTIHYTTDGTVPTASSPNYAGPISIANSSTVQAIAVLDGSLSAVALSTLTITSGTSAKLAFLQQPSNASAQATISPAVQVAVEDANGNTVTTATNPVTLALTSGTGLGGTLTVTPQSGVATFSNLTVSNAGAYTLSATSPSLSSATSTSFTISTPRGTKLAFLQQPSNALTQATISPAVQVAVEDSNGNTVTTATNPVTLALTNGTGLGGTLTVTPQSGVATFSNLTVSNAGTYTVSATSPALTSATSTSFTISLATYYLSPTGNDSNSGLTSSLPWLTPNHPLNCGDVIIAAASTSYSSSHFESGNWGTVSCPGGSNVAWLKCAQFDACKITAAGGQPGIYVDESYWGVEGWEITAVNSTSSFCFGAAPNYLAPVNIHHIIFANNIANGCQQGGFTTFNSGTTASVDYVSIIGNIAYNAAQNGTDCFSGISIYQPIQSDSLPGTHIYVAGNFSYGNFDANPCAGGIPTDGEGLIFDTFDGDKGGLPSAYAAQAVADNNILVGNGGRGLQVGNNSIGTGPFATIYLRHNTTWGNNSDLNQNTSDICGELSLFQTVNTSAFSNLAETNQTNGCGNNPIYAFFVSGGNATDDVYQNWGYAVSGTTSSGSSNSTGFLFDSDNTLGENADLANPVTPGAPNCSASSSVPACMATVIANFMPTNSAAAGFGYQAPSSTSIYDPLFPQWLCNTNLPAGLVTMGCQTEP